MKIDGRELDRQTLEHLRVTAVKRVIEDGETPSAVMDSMGLCRTAIYPWLRRFAGGDWEALAATIAQGTQPRLPEKQRQQVRRWEGSPAVWVRVRALDPDIGVEHYISQRGV